MASKLYKLYNNATCPFVHRAEIVVREKKLLPVIEPVYVELAGGTPQWYQDTVNPLGTIPTLELLQGANPNFTQGKFIHESLLIAQYLDESSSPAGALMGRDAFEKQKIMFFIGEAGDLIGAGYRLLRDPFNADKIKAWEDNVEYINRLLVEGQSEGDGPFLCNEYFSLAEVALLPFLIRFSVLLNYYGGRQALQNAPALKRLYAAGLQRPSVQETTLSAAEYIFSYAGYLPEGHPWAKAVNPKTRTILPVFFTNGNSNYSDRVQLLLNLLAPQLPYMKVEVDYNEVSSSWYKQVNYRQTVPALLTADGRIVNESWPMMLYLVEQYRALQNAVAANTNTNNMKLVDRLLPSDAAGRYAVNFFYAKVQEFVDVTLKQILLNPTPAQGDWEDLRWTANELVKVLEERDKAVHNNNNAAAVFHGGATPDLADLALLPTLARLDACHADFVAPTMNFYKEFPRLEKYWKGVWELAAANDTDIDINKDAVASVFSGNKPALFLERLTMRRATILQARSQK